MIQKVLKLSAFLSLFLLSACSVSMESPKKSPQEKEQALFCSSTGSSCAFDSDCCSNICAAGVCGATTCAPQGSPCSSSSQCCSPYACVNGTCSIALCGYRYAPCASPSDCCSGVCVINFCYCKPTLARCKSNDECCSGSCRSYKCQ